jgi:hypothetical protein
MSVLVPGIRASSTAVFAGLLACTRPLASLDDEADGTETSTSEWDDTSETSTSESEDGTSETEDDLGFIPVDPDSLVEDCNIILQDCPDGEKCVVYSSDGGGFDANQCVPVMGDQQVGEACHWDLYTGIDDCDASSMCWDVMDVDGELLGECVPFCTGSPDEPECPPTYSCVITSNESLSFCIQDCDPVLQNCGEGLGCYWTVGHFSCVFTADELPVGEPCGYINDCAPGNFCAPAALLPDCAEATCCTNFCDVTLGDSQCDALPGTLCMPFFEEDVTPPGYEDVGVCIVP